MGIEFVAARGAGRRAVEPGGDTRGVELVVARELEQLVPLFVRLLIERERVLY